MTVHVDRFGEGEPLVFLHGWGLHGDIWRPTAEALTGDRSLHLVDLPGHGRSAPLPPEPAAWASAITEAVPENATWIGWSLGGLIALQAALGDWPPKRLVLVGSTPRFTCTTDWPHAVEPDVLAEFSHALANDWCSTLLRFLALQARGSEKGREELRRLREDAFAAGEPDPAGLAAGLQLLAGVDLRGALADIRVPALVIQGERDTLAPVAAARALVAKLPNAQLETIRGAGHAPFLSHPDRFLTVLEPFLHEC